MAWPPYLCLGIVLCVVGVGLALLWGLSWLAILEVCRHNLTSVVSMCFAAFLWAFYCNAARKWGGTANGTGWFLLATGIAALAAWGVFGRPLGHNATMLGPLLIHSLLINAAAYLFWDVGVRRGSIKLMGILANFLPIGSVLFGVWYLGDRPTPGLFLGCVLVSLGALCCRHGVKENH